MTLMVMGEMLLPASLAGNCEMETAKHVRRRRPRAAYLL